MSVNIKTLDFRFDLNRMPFTSVSDYQERREKDERRNLGFRQNLPDYKTFRLHTFTSIDCLFNNEAKMLILMQKAKGEIKKQKAKIALIVIQNYAITIQFPIID